MNINIGMFYIESDPTNFILCRTRIAGPDAKIPGEEVKSIIGYYSTFESCLAAIPGHALRRSDVKSLSEALGVVKEYKDLVKNLASGV
jgi:hypothetical protein